MAERVDVTKRRDTVLALRAAGMSFAAIADQEVRTGLPRRSPQAVSVDAQRALRDRQALDSTSREAYVTMETERLDSLQRAVETTLRSATGNQCAHCGRGGEASIVLRAVDRLVRIAERRANLLGLDADRAPEKPQASPIDELRRRRDSKLAT